MKSLAKILVASLLLGGAFSHAKVITCEKSTLVEETASKLVAKVRVELSESHSEVALMAGEVTAVDDGLSGGVDRTEKLYMPNVKCSEVAAGSDAREFSCTNNNTNGIVEKISGSIESGVGGAKNLVVVRSDRDDRTETYRFHVSQCKVE